MIHTLHWIICNLVLIIHVPLVIVYLLKFNRLSKHFKLMAYLAMISAVADYIGLYRSKNYLNTHIVFHFYTICELGIFALFFHKLLKSEIDKLLVKIGTAIMYVFVLVNIIMSEGIYGNNVLASFVESLVVSIFCMLYFKQTLLLLEDKELYNNESFVLISAIFVYCLLPSLVYLFYHLPISGLYRSMHMWDLFLIASLIFSTLQFYCLWIIHKKYKRYTLS